MSGKLKEVRGRIKSVTSTQQITKAMKLVAAAKLRRAQEAIQQMRPYAEKQGEMLSNIVSNLAGDITIDYAVKRPVENVLLIGVSSDRGLCGGFNSNVIKAVKQLLENEYKNQLEAGNVTLLTIGKKVKEGTYRIPNLNLIDDYTEIQAGMTFEDIGNVAEKVMNEYSNKKYDEVKIIYTKFKNAAVQITTVEDFMPIAPPKSETKTEGEKKHAIDFAFEPNKVELINILVPKILKTQLFKTVLDSGASEQGARMTAMDSATENAKELLRDLKIEYNRARQAAITTELTEIVSGAAALENS